MSLPNPVTRGGEENEYHLCPMCGESCHQLEMSETAVDGTSLVCKSCEKDMIEIQIQAIRNSTGGDNNK